MVPEPGMTGEAGWVLLAHYHEVALKGRNRAVFEGALLSNLSRALQGTRAGRPQLLARRILVPLGPPETGLANPPAGTDLVLQRASRVFGLAWFAPALRVPADPEAISEAAVALARASPAASFAVRAKRAEPQFPLGGQALNERVGKDVKEATGKRVNLSSPELTIWVEALARTALVHSARLPGPGGLPVGVSGKVLALLSGGIDSPVAAWRMMRRGARVVLVHFHGEPYTDRSSRQQALDCARVLASWGLGGRLWLVPIGDLQREVVLAGPEGLRVVLYRRFMLRIAARLARTEGALALVTGDSLGQVASQTLENLAVVEEASDLPVFRPNIGRDKLEIVEEARVLGTLEISTRPVQDCCTLFVPRRPATRASLEEVKRVEARLEVDALVDKALAGAELVELASPEP